MSVPYHLVLRANPKDKLAVKKYYAVVKTAGFVTFDSLCTTISDRGTCIKGDIQAALDGLIFTMKQNLAEGRIVQLGEFGNFRMSVGSEGTEAAADFSAAMIERKKIVFTPGKQLMDMMKVMSFKSAGIAPASEVIEEP